jgi:hypothetical protein
MSIADSQTDTEVKYFTPPTSITVTVGEPRREYFSDMYEASPESSFLKANRPFMVVPTDGDSGAGLRDYPSKSFEVKPVVETMDGAVESIEGQMALVVFSTPGGFMERYIEVNRLESKHAAFLGARVQLVVSQIGDLITSQLVNSSADIPPAWAVSDPEFDELFPV